MPSRDQAALLAAIWVNPADDLTRLVYADWLDDHDQSDRAEFIRLQIAASQAEAVGVEVPLADWKRERDLVDAYGEQWRESDGVGPVAELTPDGFDRGFAQRIWRMSNYGDPPWELPPAGLPGLHKIDVDLLLNAPLHAIDFGSLFSRVRKLQFRHLDISNSTNVDTLLHHVHQLNQLTHLQISIELLNSTYSLDWLARLTHPNLHHLSLSCGDILPRDLIRSVEASPLARQLTAVRIYSDQLDMQAVIHITHSQQLPKLRSLQLMSHPEFPLSLPRSMGLPILSQLREFELGIMQSVSTELFFLQLAENPNARRLRKLSIPYSSTLSYDAIRKLGQSPYLDELREVWVYPHGMERRRLKVYWEAFGEKLHPRKLWQEVRARYKKP